MRGDAGCLIDRRNARPSNRAEAIEKRLGTKRAQNKDSAQSASVVL